MTETTTMPTDLSYGKVVGRFILAVADGADLDILPDAIPAEGKITIASVNPATKGYSPDPTTVIRTVIDCQIDTDGWLIANPGERGVWLLVGDYRVTYSLRGAQLKSHNITVLPTHTFNAPLDLTLYQDFGGPVLQPSQYVELSDRITALEPILNAIPQINQAVEDAEAAAAMAFGTRDDVFSQIMANPASKSWGIMNEDFYRKSELSGLMPWKLALSNQSSNRVRVAVMGSNEGDGASSYDNRWIAKMTEVLQKNNGGGRWFSVYSSLPTIESTGVTIEGNVEYPNNPNAQGFGGRLLSLKGINGAIPRGSVTLPAHEMTTVRVWYYRSNFFSAEGTLYVDGVNVATIPAIGEDAILYLDYSVTTPGDHVIKVESAAGSTDPSFRLMGVETFNNDEGVGVQVLDSTQNGATIRDLAWERVPTWEAVSTFAPNLVIIWLGEEDWLQGSIPFIEGPVADLSVRDSTYVTSPHTLLFVLPPRPVPSTGTPDPAHYAYLKSLLTGQVGANPNRIALLDLGEYFPRFEAGTNPFNLTIETNYPQTLSDTGHSWAGKIIGEFLS